MRKPRKPLSQEDYQKLLKFCNEERTIEEVAQHLNGAHSTAYICTRYLCGKFKLRRIRYKGNKRVYFKSVDNPEQFKKQCQEEDSLRKQQQSRDYDTEIVSKKTYTVEEATKVIAPGHIRVNGFSGFHGGSGKKARPRVYVASTANMI